MNILRFIMQLLLRKNRNINLKSLGKIPGPASAAEFFERLFIGVLRGK